MQIKLNESSTKWSQKHVKLINKRKGVKKNCQDSSEHSKDSWDSFCFKTLLYIWNGLNWWLKWRWLNLTWFSIEEKLLNRQSKSKERHETISHRFRKHSGNLRKREVWQRGLCQTKFRPCDCVLLLSWN